jgi:hypothetical protein
LEVDWEHLGNILGTSRKCIGNNWRTCWEQMGTLRKQVGNILGTSREYVGTLREFSGNDGNFYEIKILESIRNL